MGPRDDEVVLEIDSVSIRWRTRTQYTVLNFTQSADYPRDAERRDATISSGRA